jgi:hypothetical protein
MSEEQTNFKVTDRRLFNSDGSPRELPPDEKPAEKPAEKNQQDSAAAPVVETAASETTARADVFEPAPEPANAESPTVSAAETISASEAAPELSEDEAPFDESAIPDADDPASFVNFAMSIASNAASALGMMEHPVTHKREVDLELGKHWIDVLGMLQKKTRGNLSLPEAQILEGWLADLRMQFVSLTPAAAKTARAFTGRDIIGGK